MNSVSRAIHPTTAVGKQVLDSTNLTEIQSIMTNYFCEHKLRVVDTESLHFHQTRHLLSTVELCQIEYGTPVSIEFEDLASYYTISLPSAGEELLCLGARKTYSDASCGMVISPSQTVSLEMSGDCRKLLVRIPRMKLEAVLQQMLGHAMQQPLVFESSMDLEFGESSSWWRTVEFILAEQSMEGSLYRERLFLVNTEQLLIEGLLRGQPHNYSLELEREEKAVLPAFVRRAETFILENAHKPITQKDILAAADVPGRTLYEGFKRFGRTSPMRYLKETRMDRVREEILYRSGSATITDIAMSWWFMHLGRFSTEYKQRFGESPSETLRKSDFQ